MPKTAHVQQSGTRPTRPELGESELIALRAIRDEAYRQRCACLAVAGAVPESVLTLWNLVRWYLGETKGPRPMVVVDGANAAPVDCFEKLYPGMVGMMTAVVAIHAPLRAAVLAALECNAGTADDEHERLRSRWVELLKQEATFVEGVFPTLAREASRKIGERIAGAVGAGALAPSAGPALEASSDQPHQAIEDSSDKTGGGQ